MTPRVMKKLAKLMERKRFRYIVRALSRNLWVIGMETGRYPSDAHESASLELAIDKALKPVRKKRKKP